MYIFLRLIIEMSVYLSLMILYILINIYVSKSRIIIGVFNIMYIIYFTSAANFTLANLSDY